MTTKKGKPRLCFQGSIYISRSLKAMEAKDVQIWHCRCADCPGKLLATPMGMVFELCMPHNHDANPEEVSKALLVRRPLMNLGQAETLLSSQNKPKLCFGGYIYSKAFTCNGLFAWDCIKPSCTGQILSTPTGMVVVIRTQHNHVPDPEAFSTLKEMSRRRKI